MSWGGEQQRWFDLKRTGKLLERVKAYNPDAKVNIKEHHLLRPIPQTQLDAIINKEEFGQKCRLQLSVPVRLKFDFR